MSKELYPCIKALDFASKIVDLKRNIIVNTNIYNKNFNNDDDEIDFTEDLYIIETNANSKISLNDIIKLFNHMEKQIYKIECQTNDYNELIYVFFNGFKYNKRTKIYEAKFRHRDEIKDFYQSGMRMSIKTLEFANNVVGLRFNIAFNSNIYKHLLDTSEINPYEDFHELYGNSDKKISIDDVYDVFVEINHQFKNPKCDERSYHLENIRIDEEFISRNGTPIFCISWGS